MTSACRLCLNSSSSDYRDYKSVDQKYFEVVLPEIDITMISSPIFCINCMELLRAAYLFKTSCLETERVIKTYIERVGGVNISLSDVLMDQSGISTKEEDVKPEGFVKLESNNDTETFFNDFYNDDNSNDEEKHQYNCSICNLDFEDEGSLKRHNHLRSLRCGVCNKDFSNGYTLRRHMSSHKKNNLDEINDDILIEMEKNVQKHDQMYPNGVDICVLTCEICRESFDTKLILLEHVKSHFAVNCERCGRFYKDCALLDVHLEESHQVKAERKLFSCDICLKTFALRKSLLFHVRSHFERPRCTICDKMYYDLNCLKRHIISIHKNSKFKIKNEDTESDEFEDVDFEIDDTNLFKTLRIYLEKFKNNQCDFCNKTFKENEEFNDHYLKAHFSRPLCKICNKGFINSVCLKKHNLKVHKVEDFSEIAVQKIKLECFSDQSILDFCTNCNNSICNCKNNLKCPTCGKIMGTKSSFIRHKLTHAKRKNFICDFCQKSFLTKLYLQRHINTTHLGVPRKRTSNNIFTCDTCGLTTNNKHTLIQHIRTHTGERPYKCDLCGKAFVQSSTLGTHKRTVHSTERLFTCEYCSKSFNTKGSLTKHILEVHMVDKIEKKFSCNFCGKKYRLQSQLTCHLKWHSSERQFSCDICGKPFVDRHSVKKHRVIHFSEKQHKCEICGKGFHQKYNIKIHMKVHSRVP
ncbi:zinc finger protein 93-like [Onthophagus taurus]|uniref:zinc finger protein 93-like n=1 Tax=Onthophagus taurus TaxID=166361 RepID=UPI0039BE3C77